MADLPVPKADPAAHDEPPAKRSKLENNEGTHDDQICLSDLHQVYIDKIAKHLGVKDIFRLQLTCKDLFKKGLAAQRLVMTDSLQIHYQDDGTINCCCREHPIDGWKEKQFQATAFRFEAHFLRIYQHLTYKVLRRISEVFKGRGTITKLKVDERDPPHFDPAKLVQFLQDFQVSELDVGIFPVKFLELPVVKQMKVLNLDMDFPFSFRYFLDTDIHSCKILLNHRIRLTRPDSEEMHEVLEKWANNEKVIKKFSFFDFNYDFNFAEQILFDGWTIIDEGEEVPAERPIVIRKNKGGRRDEYRFVRADGTVLFIGQDDMLDLEFREEELPFAAGGDA